MLHAVYFLMVEEGVKVFVCVCIEEISTTRGAEEGSPIKHNLK